MSPGSSRREKGSSSPGHSRRAHHSHNGSPSKSSSSTNVSGSRSKGVPQSFGYIKRTNGSSMASNIINMDGQHQLLIGANSNNANISPNNGFQGGNRTAHVSAVPRSGKMKVSGGTQTCSTDMQTTSRRKNQFLRD